MESLESPFTHLAPWALQLPYSAVNSPKVETFNRSTSQGAPAKTDNPLTSLRPAGILPTGGPCRSSNGPPVTTSPAIAPAASPPSLAANAPAFVKGAVNLRCATAPIQRPSP